MFGIGAISPLPRYGIWSHCETRGIFRQVTKSVSLYFFFASDIKKHKFAKRMVSCDVCQKNGEGPHIVPGTDTHVTCHPCTRCRRHPSYPNDACLVIEDGWTILDPVVVPWTCECVLDDERKEFLTRHVYQELERICGKKTVTSKFIIRYAQYVDFEKLLKDFYRFPRIYSFLQNCQECARQNVE